MDSFLRKYLEEGYHRGKPESKYTIRTDRWDRQDLDAVLKELPEMAIQDEKLSAFANTGHHAFSDMYMDLVKAVPELLPDDEIRPEFLVNQHIISEADGLKETKDLRNFTVGDPVAAAMADISMEPTLETLFDKHKEEQKLADELQKMQDQMEGLEGQEADLDKMMEDAENGVPAKGKGKRGPIDFQKMREQIQKQKENLKEQMKNKHQELKDGLNKKRNQTQNILKQAMKDAGENAESLENASLMWGQEPGAIQKMDARTRLELAKKVNNPKFKKIAQLLGPLSRLAMAMQSRKTEHGHEELYDITLGSDLSRLVPSELVFLEDEHLELDFYRRWSESRLMNYALRGTEKVAKGGIVICIDSSGSMAGEPEIWSKAVALALLHIARKQKRSFYGIIFGSPGLVETYDFRDPRRPVDPEQVADFAERFMNSGTDFMTPLSAAIDLARAEFEDFGAVKADVVFVTDGVCGVSDEWLAAFLEERERLGLRVHGLSIGGHPQDEPLSTLCSHRVWTIEDLTSGTDVKDLFASV